MDHAEPLQDVSVISPRARKTVAISVIFLTLAIISVILRIWSRRIKGYTLCLNDYAMLAALLFEVGDFVTIIVSIVVGKVGYHMTSLESSQILSLNKAVVAAEVLRNSANSCIKLSILHLYLTIFPTQRFRYAIFAVMAVVICYWAVSLLRMTFICHPVAYMWDKKIKGGSCMNTTAAYFSISVINLGLDLVVTALPMPILWSLQMPTSKKVAVSMIFGMGVVTCIVTALRIVALTQLDMKDFSYSIVCANIWSTLEPCLGIISACLPVLQPALARVLGGNPLEWTRRSMSSCQSTKASTSIWSPSCCGKTDAASDTWPPLPPANRTQSSNTNKTWPMSNERRVVRFKDVEWGDYFPKRVNTVPMSVFHYPGADRRCASIDGLNNVEDSDGSISPCSVRATTDEERYRSEDSGDSSQYWD